MRKLDAAIEFITLNDAGLRTMPDAHILEWAATHQYVVVSQDYATMNVEADAQIARGLPIAGVILLPKGVDIGTAARHLHTLAAAGERGDLANMVMYVAR